MMSWTSLGESTSRRTRETAHHSGRPRSASSRPGLRGRRCYHSAMLGYVGLGSNVGDREAHLRDALIAMRPAGIVPVAVSSVWETEPVDGAGPGWFLNMVARVATEL